MLKAAPAANAFPRFDSRRDLSRAIFCQVSFLQLFLFLLLLYILIIVIQNGPVREKHQLSGSQKLFSHGALGKAVNWRARVTCGLPISTRRGASCRSDSRFGEVVLVPLLQATLPVTLRACIHTSRSVADRSGPTPNLPSKIIPTKIA